MESCRLVPVGSLNPSAWDRITLALVLTLFISCSPHKFLCYFFTFCYLYVPLIVTKAQAPKYHFHDGGQGGGIGGGVEEFQHVG